ncbi:MAG: transglutaminase TgpA family protein [Thermodesulfobacteriota bacterium]
MKTRPVRPPDKDIRQVIAALVVALLPHGLGLPPWIAVWCGAGWGYRLLADRHNWPLPSRKLRLLLTAAGFLGVLLSAGTRFGADSYIGLMAVMAALKPFEIESYRDKIITVLLAYFIVITGLFESESLIIVVHLFGSVWITTAVLIHIHSSGGALRLSGRIMLQALPVMLVLFFLFPRLPGSLWRVSPIKTGGSGFSESLSIGDVARLVQDERTAFTARFDEPPPPGTDLYWRGIVFDRFDGRSWTAGREPVDPLPAPAGKRTAAYTVTLPPQGRRHLFVLDLPVTEPPLTHVAAGYTLQARFPIRRKFYYRVLSELTETAGAASPPLLRFVTLPETGNPQARALAGRWAAGAATDEETVRAALKYFTANGFAYTLKPPALAADPIDQFLFETRRGYCEHYACAFAFLMRAAGIPARIVGGYLGGEPNPYGRLLTIRQSDAHAWTEVWLKGRGWVRIDPTAVVVPERLSGGVSAALPPEELPGFLAVGRFRRGGGIWSGLLYAWEAANNRWDIWFSGYSHLQQQALLEWMGFTAGSQARRIGLLLLFLGLAGAGIAGAYFLRPRRIVTVPDQALSAYNRFCRKLARMGIERAPCQGPRDFSALAAGRHPPLREEIAAVTELYIRLRYDESGSPEELRRLKSLVRRFPTKPEDLSLDS